MAVSPAQPVIRFGLFELDPHAGQLSRQGIKLRLPQQPVQLLAVLLERPGEVFSREELHRRLWPADVFIDFDHGLNKSIQKLREVLGDSPASPRFIETIPRVGYRFIAPVHSDPPPATEVEPVATPPQPDVPVPPILRAPQRSWLWLTIACMLAAAIGVALYLALRPHPTDRVRYTRVTDLTDPVASPAISPDGRMLAFIGADNDSDWMSTGPIYVMMLPSGEPRRITEDARDKYGLVFSPDSSQIAYTVTDGSGFSTYAISVLGGDPHLLLRNAAGLNWLDPGHLLFSRIRKGLHLGVVTSTTNGQDVRELYYPQHERGMAHYSFPSPDRKAAIVAGMNGQGEWEQCLRIALDGSALPTRVGPDGPCMAAGWSNNGDWMYFNVWVDGQSHLWRQRSNGGAPQQLTFGPDQESGLAVDPHDGSVITAVGVRASSLWVHVESSDENSERAISSEGWVETFPSPPLFAAGDQFLYYLAQRHSTGSALQLWRTALNSGQSEVMLPGQGIADFDISADGKQVLYAPAGPVGTTGLWIAPTDRSASGRLLTNQMAQQPHFGRPGEILFLANEGNNSYLESMKFDGTGRTRVLASPMHELQSVSPNRHWAVGPIIDEAGRPKLMAVPLAGGKPHIVCADYCVPSWSSSGKYLYVPLKAQARSSEGRSIAIPLGPDEAFPAALPEEGVKAGDDAGLIPGAILVEHSRVIGGKDPRHFAYVKETVHQDLFRLSLP